MLAEYFCGEDGVDPAARLAPGTPGTPGPASSGRQLSLLELGAGCGLLGLVLSRLAQVGRVVLTEHRSAIDRLSTNVKVCIVTK